MTTIALSSRETHVPPAIATAVAGGVLWLILRLPGWAELPTMIRLGIVGSGAAGIFWLTVFALRPAETIERFRCLRSVWYRP